MSTKALTKKQRRLVNELDQIYTEFNVDHRNVALLDPKRRTTYLEVARRDIARGLVVNWYTFVDEVLACQICRYEFGRARSFPQLWRTARFRNFNYYVMDELHLMQKLRYVRAFVDVPKDIIADVERLNALRNALAHSFFPENRRAKPIWKGRDIFSLVGLQALYADYWRIREFFFTD